MKLIALCLVALAPCAAAGDLFVPNEPPHESYTITCRIDPAARSLEGSQSIHLLNTTHYPLKRLPLRWTQAPGNTLSLTMNGKPLDMHDELLELPEVLRPGQAIDVHAEFRMHVDSDFSQPVLLQQWHPRLWWGFPAHADYAVKLAIPPDYTVATSGRLDQKTGFWRAGQVREFGLYLAQGMRADQAEAGDVLVRTLHTEKGTPCASLLLRTAVDAVNFYRARFGFYPYRSLTIVPGGDEPVGGYPMATALVAIHGQEKFSAKPESHWRWITAHETGHQYWLEWVLTQDPDDWGWLMIGLGIYADREYSRSHGIAERHQKFMADYADAVRKGIDSTLDRTSEMIAALDWDWNNVAMHDKGFSVISALETAMGRESFTRAYLRALHEYAGRRLGWRAFQHICEQESGQDLDWFFEQWVRSSKYLAYEIAAKKCQPRDGGFVTWITVKRIGTLAMPVPVEATFEDGGRQVQSAGRLSEIEVVEFRSASPLKDARLDPEGTLAMVIPPPKLTSQDLTRRLRDLPWSGAAAQARELAPLARETRSQDAEVWIKLGLNLYDGGFYPEALEAFQRVEHLGAPADAWTFGALVWQGQLLDLLGRRDEALAKYRQALAQPGSPTIRHDQWGMVIDKAWVRQRLEKAFQR